MLALAAADWGRWPQRSNEQRLEVPVETDAAAGLDGGDSRSMGVGEQVLARDGDASPGHDVSDAQR